MKNRILTYALVACLALLAGVFWLDSRDAKKQHRDYVEAIQDTLRTERNQYGQEVARRRTVEADLETLRSDTARFDSTLKDLMAKLDRKTREATYWKGVTAGRLAGGTTSVPGETLRINDTVYLYPKYRSHLVDKWGDFKIEARRDTTLLDYRITNEWFAEQQTIRTGFLGLGKSYGEVKLTNLNPHTRSTDLQTFRVATPPQRRGLWFLGGAVSGFLLNSAIQR